MGATCIGGWEGGRDEEGHRGMEENAFGERGRKGRRGDLRERGRVTEKEEKTCIGMEAMKEEGSEGEGKKAREREKLALGEREGRN